MKNEDILYRREILFSTNDQAEIGVVKVKLLGIKKNNKVIVVIEPKSEHNPLEYVESLLRTLEIEMFSRLNIKITENVDAIFISDNKGVRVIFEDKNSITPFHLEKIEQHERDMLNV